jgi:hypothetical protein
MVNRCLTRWDLKVNRPFKWGGGCYSPLHNLKPGESGFLQGHSSLRRIGFHKFQEPHLFCIFCRGSFPQPKGSSFKTLEGHPRPSLRIAQESRLGLEGQDLLAELSWTRGVSQDLWWKFIGICSHPRTLYQPLTSTVPLRSVFLTKISHRLIL